MQSFKNKRVISLIVLFFLILVIPLSVFLVQKSQENRSKAANNSDANPKITGLVLPSVLGFQSDLFSGAANISYPISVPAGPGGIKPSVSISYSTGSVDDLHTNTPDWSARYIAQAQLAGLGWNIAGVDSITKGSRGQYYITVGGASYKLISRSYDLYGRPNSEDWDTSPKGFIRVKHNPSNWGYNEWIVTGKDGTTYYFGSNENSKATVVDVPDPDNNPTSQVDVVYRWMLTKIIDTHSNTIEYSYTKEEKTLTGYPYCKEANRPYVKAILPQQIKWANNHFTIDFIFEDRTDWNFEAVNEGGCTQTHFTNKRLKELQVKTDSQLVRKYILNYRYPLSGIKHSLLTSVTQFGKDGTTSLPPYTFDYEGVSNETYLKWANNGYNGKVIFSYLRTKPFVIGRDGTNWSETTPGSERTRVIKKITEDGMGNTITNRTMYESDTFESNGYVGVGYVDKKLSDPAGEFEFLGFANAKDILYEKNKDGNNPSDIVNMTKKYFFQKDTVDQIIGGQNRTYHFPDPRKGKAYKTEIQDKTGRVLTSSEEDWKYDIKPHYNEVDGTQDITYFPLVWLNNTKGTIDGVTKKTSYRYDQYQNTTHVIEEGDISKTGDEKFTVTSYYYNTTNWIINRPRLTSLFRGTPDGNKQEISRTGFYYDGLGWDQPPTKGDVTMTDNVSLSPNEVHVQTKVKYDQYGNQIEVIDPKGNTTKTLYDPTYNSYPIKLTNAFDQTMITEYDYILGVPIKLTNLNGVETNFTYDNLGRSKKIIMSGDTNDKPSVEYIIKDQTPMVVGTKSRIHSNTDDVTEIYQFYNGLGQLLQTQSYGPEQNQIIVNNNYYNSAGLLVEKPIAYYQTVQIGSYQNPLSALSEKTEYDALGRQTKMTSTDGKSILTQYAGQMTTVINENNVKNTIEKDVYGNIIKSALYNSNAPNAAPYSIFRNEYDYGLNVATKTWDGLNNETAITYNGFGKKIQSKDPDMGIWKFKYDLNGNIIEQTDGKNQTIKLDYDKLNRIVKKTTSDNSTVNYYYDENQYGKGNKTKMVDPSGNTIYEYDVRGRLKKETKTITISQASETMNMEYSYDNIDRLLTIKYPDNEQIKYSYDRAGRQYKMEAGTQTLVSNTTYSAPGKIKKIDFLLNNNQTMSTEYLYYWGQNGERSDLRLKNIQTSTPSTRLFSKKYTYDNVGNITSIIDEISNETESFTYDGLNRLLSANSAYSANYSYDQIGRILSKTEGNNTKSFTYNTTSPIHAPKSVNGITYQYDANGNLIKDEAREITYDFENRPIAINVLGGQATSPIPNTPTPTPLPSAIPTATPSPTTTTTPIPTSTPTNGHPTNLILGKGINLADIYNFIAQLIPSHFNQNDCQIISMKLKYWKSYKENYQPIELVSAMVNNNANKSVYIKCKSSFNFTSQ